MSIFVQQQHNTPIALKAWLDQQLATDREDATLRDLTRLYATSVIIYRAANKRADNVAQVPLDILDGKNEPLSDTHPLMRMLARDYRDNLRRSEIAMSFVGRNLLWKRRAYNDMVYKLRWVNPNQYHVELGIKGLRGFNVYRRSRSKDIPVRFLTPSDVVYMHGVDLDDDFDGVSPAEVALRHGELEVEMAETQVAFMRNRAVPLSLMQPAADSVQKIDEAERNRMSDFLRRVYQGSRNAGRTLLQRFRWEWIQLQVRYDEIEFSEHYANAYQAVCIAFDMPVSLVLANAANYATAEVDRRDWAQGWLKPRMEWYGEQITEQLLREPELVRKFGTGLHCVPNTTDVEIFKEDVKAKTEVINLQLQGGYRDLYSAQLETGVKKPDEKLKGYYMWGGVPTPIDQIDAGWQARLVPTFPAAPPSIQPDTPATTPLLPPPATQPATPDESKAAEPSVCLMLDLANHPDLIALQNRVKEYCAGMDVTWNTPDSFHVTVLYAPSVAAEQRQALQAALDSIEVPELALKIGQFNRFDNLGEYALHFRIRNNVALLEFQDELYTLCQQIGIPVSAYSVPDAYKPHITMGYSKTKPPIVPFSNKLTVKPTALLLAVGDDTVWKKAAGEVEDTNETISLPAPALDAAKSDGWIPDLAFKELKDWQAIVGRKGVDYPFKASYLPRRVVDLVQASLDAGESPDLVFSVAKQAFALAAFKSYEDTRRAFINDITVYIQQGQADETNRRNFAAKMRSALRRYGLVAFRDGMNAEGYDPESFSKAELAVFRAWESETSGYISNFGAEIFGKQYVNSAGEKVTGQGISEAEIAIRAEYWANKSLRDIYLKGQVLAAPTKRKIWRYDPRKEHCEDCEMLNGRVMTLENWEKFVMPGSSKLACWGANCGCGLEDTDEPVTEGTLPRLVGRKSAAEPEAEPA